MSFFALLLLLLAGGVVLGGLALAAVLLGNRHTRGATIAFGSFVALIAVALIGWRMATMNQMEQHARNQARVFAQREQVRNLEVQAEHLRNIAESYEQNGGIDARQVAEQYREDASGLLQEMRIQQGAIPSHAGSSSSTRWRIGLAGAVVAPLVALLMFLVFKHAGPAIGTVAVAAPLLLLFFGYISFERRSSYYSRPENTTSYTAPIAPTPVAVPEEHIAPHPNVHSPVAHVATNDMEVAAVAVEEVTATVDDSEIEDAEVVNEEEIDPIADTSPIPVDEIPDWVSEPPKSVENVYRRVVESGWQQDRPTCERWVRVELDNAVFAYLHELAVEENRGPIYVPPLERLGISPRFIRENLVSNQYFETRDFPHAKGMQNLHVQLEFDRAATDELLRRWRDYERRERVGMVAGVMGGVLASLAGVLGLIKLDTYTKGYYTKRLFIGVPAAIIGVLVLLNLA